MRKKILTDKAFLFLFSYFLYSVMDKPGKIQVYIFNYFIMLSHSSRITTDK